MSSTATLTSPPANKVTNVNGPQSINNRPTLTKSGLSSSLPVQAIDEFGEARDVHIVGERPLTVYLDKKEIVTLMTLGSEPELLTLGYLKNQRLIQAIEQIAAVQVDWETASAVVTTRAELNEAELASKLSKKTVTTGCGQGTVFGDIMENLESITIPQVTISQSYLYQLLAAISEFNEIYKKAGSVHGCAICRGTEIVRFIEDVGRHNAVDALAGHMWLHGLSGDQLVFYTTGRLTSEMVIKVAHMGIPVVLSRSGVTQMGLEMAQKTGVMLIARAKGKHFLLYNGAEHFEFDEMPKKIER